jgi:hypothetical protein
MGNDLLRGYANAELGSFETPGADDLRMTIVDLLTV